VQPVGHIASRTAAEENLKHQPEVNLMNIHATKVNSESYLILLVLRLSIFHRLVLSVKCFTIQIYCRLGVY
jgi:hypothetical protein